HAATSGMTASTGPHREMLSTISRTGARRSECTRENLQMRRSRVASVAAPGDRRAYQAAPLGPRAVVIPYVGVSQELCQCEPRVGRPLTNPAIRNDLLVGRDAVTLVDVLQLAERL